MGEDITEQQAWGKHDIEVGYAPNRGAPEDSSQSSPQPPSPSPSPPELEIAIEPSPSSKEGTGSFLPVLIFPGFMSSGLEVIKSGVSDEEWAGVRVWLNLEKLGLKTLHSAGALKGVNEGAVPPPPDRPFSDLLCQGRERSLDCKSDWLQHVSLSADLRTEREGMEVRPIEGLGGVDYLGQHEKQYFVQHLINSSTYVFGPVINVLKKAGYTENNLDAAPYDWRVPPLVLEERDRYFTRTMRKVEELYERNGDTPVVLVCHSMGCRICHYFLNFALKQSDGGQDWLDKYVHTYMPVGPPTLGAPKALRGMVDGDKMGLDAFVSDEEGLVLGRSLGSALFLLPREIPLRNAPPNAVLRTEGALLVSVSTIECKDLLGDLQTGEDVPRIRLQIKFGEKTLNTAFQQPVGDKLSVHFRDRFLFPSPPSLPESDAGGSGAFQMILLQPGLDKAAKSAKKTCGDTWICGIPFCIIDSIFILLKFVLYGTYLFFRRMFKGSPEEALPSAQDIQDVAFDTGTKLASATLASSKELNLSDVLAGKHEAQFSVEVVSEARGIFFKSKPRAVAVNVGLKFGNPMEKAKELENTCSPIAKPIKPARDMARHGLKDSRDGCPVTNVRKKNEHVQYEPAAGGNSLLLGEGMQYIFDVMRDCYDSDPLGPRTHSSIDPPPVKRVKAIYGVNLPTEVGAVYRKASLFLEDGKLQRLYELDTTAGLKPYMDEYQIQRGILMETKKTPQVILGPSLKEDHIAHESDDGPTKKKSTPLRVFGLSTQGGNGSIHESVPEGELVHRSGDGTVPYWSLQHCRTWQGPCDVSVDEIEGAEHREILANSTFHKILVEYVTQGSAHVSAKTIS